MKQGYGATRVRTRRARTLACIAVALGTWLPGSAHAQTWETWANHPGDDKYKQLDYIVCFVATVGHAEESSETPPHFGLDVLSANNVSAQGPNGGLWALMPSGDVVKLFPLASHEAAPGLIDTPLGQLGNGMVVEPNMSEDGQTVYFAYFHDATWELYDGGWQSEKMSYKGADLYSMDLSALIADHGADPNDLPVKRLTFKEYTGNPKNDVQQTESDKYEDAINPTLASTTAYNDYWGNVDMHMIEMRTASGLKAVWVSNRSRVGNGNFDIGDSNQNFNIFIADLLEDGSLGPARQFQYYTTTSALSPTPMRNGMSFSYQSSTDGYRRWDIQAIDSVGKWSPLFGYGHQSELFHLGTFLVVQGHGGLLEDHFLGLKYYNMNDGGFGQIHSLRMADAGINTFKPTLFGTVPRQVSTLLTEGVFAVDKPSAQVNVGGELKYIGKFSSPRAGRIGGEYLASYTPTSANRWIKDADGNKVVFDAHLVYRPSIAPFEPWEDVDVATGKGLYTVIDDSTGDYNLIWPTPVLSWFERTGMAQQEFTETIADPDSTVARGEPFAQVGSSAIYNTDIRPYDCWLESDGEAPFSPNAINSNEEINLSENFEGLRRVYDQDDFCKYLQPENVLGIAVNMTSNKVDLDAINTMPYLTDGNGRKEATELLGVYSVEEENESDYSFQATIPADVPFEFHLLDNEYGLKLVDVRSWHSLQPRETRTDCGGCHQHEEGFGIPWEGVEASLKPPLDMTSETKFVTYDADCKPSLAVISDPTKQLYEWQEDIWPQFDQFCGGCHDSNESSDATALAAFEYETEGEAYLRMRSRNYASSEQGALGSPAFWAAYGERTDGRDNDLPVYQPDYASGDYGYRFSSIHATAPGLCASSNQDWADWVLRFGQWIDHHMPRDKGVSQYGYKFDRFHPTVDFAISETLQMRFGYWDNGGLVTLEFFLNGNPIQSVTVPNGSFQVAIPALALTDRIKVIASDPDDNRQIKEKTVQELVDDFVIAFF